ncbi:MAG TPA: polyprenyl synthetase family protein [Paludibacter sp.]|nr:polyprenyl synthetase family protein [Paludibacter sp.]
MKTFDEITAIVASELENINWGKEPVGLYAPIGYVLSMGGKRIRPALALMACNLFSDDVQPALNTALGLEIFHNFTLLHDDIMDRADVRRGKPTVHKKWDDNTAILSGDVMQIVAYQYIAKTPVGHLKPVLDLFSQTAAEICEGQQYDVDFERRDDVKAEEYLEMIRLKTAVLLACALKCGAIAGGAGEEDARLLYDFGIGIGLAFQLKDDLLDVYGNEAVFGKKIGGDILCNKKTYLLINALDLAEGNDAEELRYWLGCTDENLSGEKIRAITSIYDRLGIRQICEDKMLVFYTQAIAYLEKVGVSGNKKQGLRKLAENLMFRKE